MKTKTRFLLFSLIAGAGFSLATHAQQDVTDQYLVNPSFETGDATGWAVAPENISFTWNGVNTDGDPETKTGEYIYCIYHNPVPECELYQTLEVPNGDYMVSCDLMVAKWSSGTRITTQRLFANNNVTYFGKKKDYSELNLVSSEDYMFAGCTETEGDASALQTITVERVTVTDGTLTIGIRTNNISADGNIYTDRNGSGWFKADNFRLYYFDGQSNLLEYYKTRLNQQLNALISYDFSELPGATGAAITALHTKAKDIYLDSEDEDEVIAATEEIKLFIDEVDEIHATWKQLNNLLIFMYEELVALNYPGLTAFTEVWEAGIDIRDGEASTPEDIAQAIEDFHTAVTAYKFTGFSIATPGNPVDATWLLANADMEEGASDWVLTGFKTNGAGNNYSNFGGTFLENWVNSSSGTLANCSASQTLTNLPDGIYQISAAVIACNQGNLDYEITGAYLFGNSTTKSLMTGNGEGIRFDFNVIATGGSLTLGMKIIETNANWVAFDNVELAYLGKDKTLYEEAYTTQINHAKLILSEEEFLPFDQNALQEVIQAAEAADRSTVEAIGNILSKLHTAIIAAETALQEYKDFKAGSYAKALAIVEDDGSIGYDYALKDLMANIIQKQEDLLALPETTSEVYPALNEQLDIYLSFAAAYHSCMEFGNNATEDEVTKLIASVLSEQIAWVDEDAGNIESAKKIFTSSISFCTTYTLALKYANNDEYPEDQCVELYNIATAQMEIIKADISKAAEAEDQILKTLGNMRFGELEASEMTEVTSVALINPGVEEIEIDDIPLGWTIEKIDGNTHSSISQHWSGDTGGRYLDSWNQTAGKLAYTALQEIKGIPNGTYKVVAAMRSSGNGAYLFAEAGGQMKIMEIPIDYNTGGSIWEEAPEDSEIKLANGGIGYGWNWIELTGINVNTNRMTIGCSTNSAITGGTPWSGNWVSADDFKLYWSSEDFIGVGIEDLLADPGSKLIAYAENGYVIVEGEQTYSLSTLDGMRVSVDAQLTPGIYIVRAGSKTAKVVVK